jgi:hypothetical protein
MLQTAPLPVTPVTFRVWSAQWVRCARSETRGRRPAAGARGSPREPAGMARWDPAAGPYRASRRRHPGPRTGRLAPAATARRRRSVLPSLPEFRQNWPVSLPNCRPNSLADLPKSARPATGPEGSASSPAPEARAGRGPGGYVGDVPSPTPECRRWHIAYTTVRAGGAGATREGEEAGAVPGPAGRARRVRVKRQGQSEAGGGSGSGG